MALVLFNNVNYPTAERVVAKCLREEMDKGTHYKKIYKIAKKRVEDLVVLLGKTSVIDTIIKVTH